MLLREQVLRGSIYLVLRQGVSVGLRVVGVFLLTRLIGPGAYGLYAAAFGITFFFSQAARMGTDVYLVRREGSSSEEVYHQAFSFLLLSGVGLAGLGFLTSPILRYWLSDSRFLPPLWVLLLLLPLTVLPVPAVAKLERALDYQRVAVLELVEQVLYYVLAVALAWRGLGVWAPVIGYSISQAWLVVGSYTLAGYRPRWHWSRELWGEMLGYGLGYSASGWIWQLRTVLNPLIIGRYLGPEGVGFVSLAGNIVDSLGFVKTATWRLSIAALAKVQQDLPRLRRALEEAMALQVLALAPLLAAFALVAPLLLPLLFGARWAPALVVYPFIALGGLVNAVFSMHSSVLYVRKQNKEVAIFHLVHVALFAAAALSLVPRVGLLGWGLAEVIALASYLVIHRQVIRLFGVDYTRVLPWLLAFVPPLFTSLIGWPQGLVLWLTLLGVPFSYTARTQLEEYWSYVRRRYA